MNKQESIECSYLSRKMMAVIILGLLVIGFMPEIVGLLESLK